MRIENLAEISGERFSGLEKELAELTTLGRVLSWAKTKPKGDVLPQTVAEVITQDEFTHDVVVPYKDLFLVFDTT